MAEVSRNKLVVLAILLAERWAGGLVERGESWDRLRDWVDGATGGELDCQPLDILTDLVMSNVNRRTAVAEPAHG